MSRNLHMLLFLSIPFFVYGLFILVFLRIGKKQRELNENWASQSVRGKYRVLYKDGNRSQLMNLSTARQYAEMFDGIVVPKSEKGSKANV